MERSWTVGWKGESHDFKSFKKCSMQGQDRNPLLSQSCTWLDKERVEACDMLDRAAGAEC